MHFANFIATIAKLVKNCSLFMLSLCINFIQRLFFAINELNFASFIHKATIDLLHRYAIRSQPAVARERDCCCFQGVEVCTTSPLFNIATIDFFKRSQWNSTGVGKSLGKFGRGRLRVNFGQGMIFVNFGCRRIRVNFDCILTIRP